MQEEPVRPNTPSERLRWKIALLEPPLAAISRRLITDPRIADIFAEYLITFHCIIRTTVPLMEAAIERAETMAVSDPVAAGVAAFLEKHVEEERDHDEWLLDDLDVIGFDRASVLGRVPTPTIASLAGSQYYWALHYHPVALLGYFAFMEGSPPTEALINDLMTRTGYPRAAFRTLAKHGELDPRHSDEIARTIDSLPLGREHEVVLGFSAMSTSHLLASALEEILEGFDESG